MGAGSPTGASFFVPDQLAVAALQPVVKEIFEISRFNFVVKSFATAREAIAWMSPDDAAAWDAARPQ